MVISDCHLGIGSIDRIIFDRTHAYQLNQYHYMDESLFFFPLFFPQKQPLQYCDITAKRLLPLKAS